MDKKQFHELIQYFVKQRVRDEGTINSMMDMELVTADFHTKSVVLAFPVKDWQMNPAENLHGGIIATALDITMGCISYVSGNAVFTPTIQMAVNYVGGVSSGDTLLVEGICDHARSRMSQTRAIARSKKSGKVVATANGSYIMNTKQ